MIAATHAWSYLAKSRLSLSQNPRESPVSGGTDGSLSDASETSERLTALVQLFRISYTVAASSFPAKPKLHVFHVVLVLPGYNPPPKKARHTWRGLPSMSVPAGKSKLGVPSQSGRGTKM